MKVRVLGIGCSLVIAAAAIACSGPTRRSGFNQETDPTLGAENDGKGFTGEKTSDCAANSFSDKEKDYDGDGYALKDDCDECNVAINKGAYDVPGNGVDEDCSGKADDDAVECDDSLDIGTSDAFDGAKALGLCKKATPDGKDWGVIEAKWVRPDGSKLSDLRGVGVLPDFGVNKPPAGQAMVAVSSGFARAPGQDGFRSGETQSKRYSSGTPDGYPKESPACPGKGASGDANDGAGLELKIRVPSNAKSFSYQQFFFTYEYIQYVCSSYNDFFVAMLDPIPSGLPDGNIAFDQDGNPISVNNSFFQVCRPGSKNGKSFDCPLGTDLLEGTGFERNGGTGWLTTTAPVKPGSEITLLFTVWDQDDDRLDSTVLIDDFKWSLEEGAAVTKPTGPK